MPWWGRVVGGTLGAVVGGPIGAVLGYVAGGFFDKGVKQNFDGEFSSNDRRQTTFYAATFSVLGYIAKLDGYVSPREIQYAENIMRHMSLDQDQRNLAVELFRAGKEDDFQVGPVLQQFAKECGNRRNVKMVFLEIQISGAMSDGSLDAIEIDALEFIAEILGFNRSEFNSILQSLSSQHSSSVREARGVSLSEDYKLLGLKEGASRDEVKRAYRRKMSQYHPDKLVSKGLPDEMIDIATERTKQFRAAYERIQTELKSRMATH